MSRGEPTDLVCRARRRELGADEWWRLDALLRSSGEVRLFNSMLSEFERESRVQPGDDVLLARIGARLLDGVAAPPRRARRRVAALVLAAAVFLVGGLAWAWHAAFEKPSAVEPSQPQSSAQPRTQPSTARQRAASAPAIEVVPVPSSAIEESVPPPGAASPRAAPQKTARSKTPSAASELFARANLLRRQGRSSDAAAMYRLILDGYPTEREAAPARLALAKLLRAKDPARALSHFRSLAQGGGALRPEALWGIAESARALGDGALETQALSDLVREFPHSPYADVTRSRKLGLEGKEGARGNRALDGTP